MKRTTMVAGMASMAVGAILLSGCSSTDDAATAPASAVEAASEAAVNADMVTLCEQMVADGLSPEDATALAESNGFVARVGTIDGEPQAVTMDYREDRFTFEVADGVVVGCTYG